MIRVGVAGLGFMGRTHLDVYRARDDVDVVAVADLNPAFLSGAAAAASNIAGAGESFPDLGKAKRYADAAEMVADPDVDAIDVCLPTVAHAPLAEAAIRARKHVLVEKPIARTADEAERLATLAEASDRVVMPAMCVRFWPGWTWLKDVLDDRRYGRCRGLHLTRFGAALPAAHYRDGAMSGGAILDLHLHDTDFVQHLFGVPRSVTSFGYSHTSGELDHVLTRYEVDDGPLVTAEGAWIDAEAFPFVMRYTAHFDGATACYDNAAAQQLIVYRPDAPPEPIALGGALGYAAEIDYFVECIQEGRRPSRVTMREAAEAIRIVEAEVESARRGGTPVKI